MSYPLPRLMYALSDEKKTSVPDKGMCEGCDYTGICTSFTLNAENEKKKIAPVKVYFTIFIFENVNNRDVRLIWPLLVVSTVNDLLHQLMVNLSKLTQRRKHIYNYFNIETTFSSSRFTKIFGIYTSRVQNMNVLKLV